MTDEITREEATERLEAIFNSNLEGEELEKMLESIPQRLDKFEGKWPKLIMWAEEKFGPAGEGVANAEAEAVVDEVNAVQEADEEWAVLRTSMSSDPNNPETWKAMSDYFAAKGKIGRSNACLETSEALS